MSLKKYIKSSVLQGIMHRILLAWEQLPANHWRLQDVTAPSTRIDQHITLPVTWKIVNFTLCFNARKEKTIYMVLISQL